jgi:predicted AlkP superfamily phosphohydrolase/phosphomutase
VATCRGTVFRLVLAGLILESGCASTPLEQVPAPSGKVLLVALDGATWDVIDPLMAEGKLPSFAALCARGTRGPLTSMDGVSPTLFTTIATGKTPEQHGVLRFLKKDQQPYTNADRRVRALWNIVSERGGTANVVGWFTTWPADVVRGSFISDRCEGPLPGGASPPSLDLLLERTGSAFPEEAALRETERLYGPAIPRGSASHAEEREYANFESSLVSYYRTDRLRLTWAETILREAPADFNAVFFKGIDSVSHLGWIYADTRQSLPRFRPRAEASARYGQTIARYYAFVDEALGRLLAAAPPDTDVVVVSDHGFGPNVDEPGDVVYVLNPLLARAGLIVTDAAGRPDPDRSLLFDPTAYWNEHWPSRKLRLNDDAPESRAPEGVLARLRALRAPGGLPVFEEVRLGEPGQIVVDLDPRLAKLADRPEGAGLVERRLGHSGTHRPQGIVLLAGPHVRRGAPLRPADLYDVAPTVLRLLGLPAAMDMRGRALDEALRPEALGVALPPVASYESKAPLRHLTAAPLHKALDDEFRDRLRSLGYIR